MLMSNKIIKTIEAEIKSQKALLKLLTTQEDSYGITYDKPKEDIQNTIEYYERVLKEAA